MTSRAKPVLTGLVILGVLSVLAWSVYHKLDNRNLTGKQNRQKLPAPVEVAAVENGTIEQMRSFTGTLEARSEFVVAPKIGGRMEQLQVDLADSVKRGQVVAVLDDAEYVQEVARARADLEVEKAPRRGARPAQDYRARTASASSRFTGARRAVDFPTRRDAFANGRQARP